MSGYWYACRQRKEGEYYYAPYGRKFQIYKVTHAGDGYETAEKVMGEWYMTREEAKARVYELNGWRRR